MPATPAVRVHWSPLDAGTGFINLCETAEAAGIHSIHVPGSGLPAIDLATEASRATPRIAFRIECEAASIEQAIRQLGARLIVHLREAALTPDMTAWSGTAHIDVEGDSTEAAFFAIKYGRCLFRRPGRPEQVRADSIPIRHFGKQFGLVFESPDALEESIAEYSAGGVTQFIVRASAETLLHARLVHA